MGLPFDRCSGKRWTSTCPERTARRRCTGLCARTTWRRRGCCSAPAPTPKLANRYGVTPLFLACSNGNAAMIRLLLDAGADPNSEDPTGETALMEAARVGTLDAVKLLLERGAELDAKDPAFQQTALMVAVRENHPDVVALSGGARRRRQCQDQNGRHARVGPAELRAGVRSRRGHRARRVARARTCGTRSRERCFHSYTPRATAGSTSCRRSSPPKPM